MDSGRFDMYKQSRRMVAGEANSPRGSFDSSLIYEVLVQELSL